MNLPIPATPLLPPVMCPHTRRRTHMPVNTYTLAYLMTHSLKSLPWGDFYTCTQTGLDAWVSGTVSPDPGNWEYGWVTSVVTQRSRGSPGLHRASIHGEPWAGAMWGGHLSTIYPLGPPMPLASPSTVSLYIVPSFPWTLCDGVWGSSL